MSIKESFIGEIEIDLKQLSPNDVGVEIVITNAIKNGSTHIYQKYKAELISVENKIAKYTVKGAAQKPGFYNYAIRIYAKNELLPYQHDSGFVMWG